MKHLYNYDKYVKLFRKRSKFHSSKRGQILRNAGILLLFITLPLFIWAVLTQRIELRKRAATSEPPIICWNRVIETNGRYQWPDSCKGNPSQDLQCAQILMNLPDDEATAYQGWVRKGRPHIPGCIPPTPSCMPLPPCYFAPSGQPRYVLNSGINYCPPSPLQPLSCYYKQVECFKAPCPTIQVCPGSPTPTPTPSCTPYPACYYPISPDQPRCTLTSGINYCPPWELFGLTVNGSLDQLKVDQTMPLSIVVWEKDNTPGTPNEGFNVQVAVDHWPLNNTPSVFSANAVYDNITQAWKITVPGIKTAGNYRLQVHAYCSQDNSICSIRYGQGRQRENTTYFIVIGILTPTPTVSSTPIITPTPTPTPKPQTMEFRVKLTGVAGGDAEGGKVSVKFLMRDGSVQQLSSPLAVTHVVNGVYKASAILTNPFPAVTQFMIKIKGEKHVAIKFCKQVGQSGPCDDGEYITVPNPVPLTYSFDLTGIPLPPGDVYPQDGIVNQTDIDRIKALLSKPTSSLTAADLLVGDLNYDGSINVYDIFLILQTLRVRYDE